jgi:hypothetical protein
MHDVNKKPSQKGFKKWNGHAICLKSFLEIDLIPSTSCMKGRT